MIGALFGGGVLNFWLPSRYTREDDHFGIDLSTTYGFLCQDPIFALASPGLSIGR